MRLKIQIILFALAAVALVPQGINARSWSAASAANKSACNNWCDGNKHCSHCSTTYNCGSNYERIKFWGGYGRDYSACRKAAQVNSIWSDYDDRDIHSTTKTLVVTLGGSGASKTSKDDGFEWFCEDFVYGTSLTKNIKCISAYATVATSSKTLSSNIENVIGKIRNKTGRTPTVVLIGKSMGGCKLQHAVYKRSLNNNTIHTFIGVDTSCWVDKHWQLNDMLLFRNNVKRIFNFYQTNGEAQTGNHLVFLDRFSGAVSKNSEGEVRRGGRPKYDSRAPQINVMTSNYDMIRKRYLSGRMCSTKTTHADAYPIDTCTKLRNAVFQYIKSLRSGTSTSGNI